MLSSLGYRIFPFFICCEACDINIFSTVLEDCWQCRHVIHTFFAAVYSASFVTVLSLSRNKYVSFICVKIAMENMIISLENIEKSYPKVNCSKENTCLQIWSVWTFYPLLIVVASLSYLLLWHSLSYLRERAWNTSMVKSHNMKEEFNTCG
jgi:hypothetical protein